MSAGKGWGESVVGFEVVVYSDVVRGVSSGGLRTVSRSGTPWIHQEWSAAIKAARRWSRLGYSVSIETVLRVPA